MFERRSSLLKQINASMPPDLGSTFLTLLHDYERRLAERQLAAAKLIFIWVAFANVQPTVEEVMALLKHGGYEDFELEEELQQSQLRRYLFWPILGLQ